MKLKEGIIDKTFIASNRDEYFKIRGGRNNNMNEISFYCIWRSKHGKQINKIIAIKNNKITNSRWC